eukprot:TRINITY_DN3256_c0_g3_i1.p1 TRINITY_DN3256_c0_g3~~TRINITY_DN3256_c0_g3_i1.p1  ORF type:complete len:494 (+),score=135.20 TRINITY_DN3256_c0_g3_i1:80-1561(+)
MKWVTFVLLVLLYEVCSQPQEYSTRYLHLNGDGYVDLNPSVFYHSLQEFSFECWYYIEEDPDKEGGDVKDSKLLYVGVDDYRYLYVSPRTVTENLRFAITRLGQREEQALEVSFPLGGYWHHVAVTLNKQGIGKLYVDGNLKDLKMISVSPKDFGVINYAYIGKSTSYGDPLFVGYVDDLRFWSIERSQDDIKKSMQDCIFPLPPSPTLFGLFDFDENRDLLDPEEADEKNIINRVKLEAGEVAVDGELKGDSLVSFGFRAIINSAEACLVVGESGFEDFPENGVFGTFKNTWHTEAGHSGFYASSAKKFAGTRSAHVAPVVTESQEAWLISPATPLEYEPGHKYRISFWTLQDIRRDGSRCIDGAMWLINDQHIGNQSLPYDTELDIFTNRRWGGSKVWCTERVRNWTRVETDITHLVQLTDLIQVKFMYFSLPSRAEERDGWYIDLVQILKCSSQEPYKQCSQKAQEKASQAHEVKYQDHIAQTELNKEEL